MNLWFSPFKLEAFRKRIADAKTKEEVQELAGGLYYVLRLHVEEDLGLNWDEEVKKDAARIASGDDEDDGDEDGEGWKKADPVLAEPTMGIPANARPQHQAHSSPPFLPGDRVRVSDHWLGRTTGAPRKKGIFYVRACYPNPHFKVTGAAESWFVELVGRPGFKPHGEPHTGHYNAGFFELVRREPQRG